MRPACSVHARTVLAALAITFAFETPVAFGQDGYIGRAPVSEKQEKAKDSVIMDPGMMFLQVEVGVGRSTLKYSYDLGGVYHDDEVQIRYPLVGLDVHVRVPAAVVTLSSKESLIGRIRFSTGGTLIDWEDLRIPVALGPEVALRIGPQASGVVIAPYVAAQYGANIWATKSHSDNPSWGVVITVGLDAAFPSVPWAAFSLSFQHAGLGPSWDDKERDITDRGYSQSRLAVGFSFPIARIGTLIK